MRYDQSVRALKDLLQRGWLGEPVLATIDMRAIPHWMPWSEGAAVAVHVRHEHPSSRHVPLLVRHAGPRPGQHAARSAHALSAPRRHQPLHPRIRQRLPGQRPGTTSGPARPRGRRRRHRHPLARRGDARAWPAAPSAGRATRRGRRARSTSPRSGSRAYWLQPRWPEVWFPDAFVGTMAQLLCALEDGDRTGDQRPRQPGDDCAVRGGVRGGDGASGDDGAASSWADRAAHPLLLMIRQPLESRGISPLIPYLVGDIVNKQGADVLLAKIRPFKELP